MTEENNQVAAEGQASPNEENRQFSVKRIYLKDLSFETPQGTETFNKQWKPQVSQDVSTKTSKLDADHYEVVLTVTVTVKDGESTIYLAEVQQAGIFLVGGVEGVQLAHLLNSLCPNILFPYAREVIDNVATKGSFPALMLPPLNFDALFQQALAQAKAKAEAEGKTSDDGEEVVSH